MFLLLQLQMNGDQIQSACDAQHRKLPIPRTEPRFFQCRLKTLIFSMAFPL